MNGPDISARVQNTVGPEEYTTLNPRLKKDIGTSEIYVTLQAEWIERREAAQAENLQAAHKLYAERGGFRILEAVCGRLLGQSLLLQESYWPAQHEVLAAQGIFILLGQEVDAMLCRQVLRQIYCRCEEYDGTLGRFTGAPNVRKIWPAAEWQTRFAAEAELQAALDELERIQASCVGTT
ncbi:hypothetical protein BKA62DRAFT_772001 [Auriculariales sp. MPI-PUGE-AT-0066]|nr:hypothetical protein BKA62DRAFT_772001 [Auriculariales sp. MPI-PUGE-AT-0066]